MVTRQLANEAIVNLIQSKDFKQCIDKIEPDYLRADLASEVYLALLETSPDKIVSLHERKELRFYAVRIIFNMACSNTSPFYKKFRSLNAGYTEYYSDGIEEAEDSKSYLDYYKQINIDTLFDESESKNRKKLELLALSLVDDLYWYDAGILKLYLYYGDYRAVSKATKIPFTSVYCTVQKAAKELKAKIDKAEIPHDKQINGIIDKIQRILKVDKDNSI